MPKQSVLDFKRGDVVRAVQDLDPKGANVKAGEIGVVFEEANAYGDGNGPMVRWISYDEYDGYCVGGACNVYDDQVRKA